MEILFGLLVLVAIVVGVIKDSKSKKTSGLFLKNTCHHCLASGTWFYYRKTGESRNPYKMKTIGKEKTILAPRSDGSYEIKQEGPTKVFSKDKGTVENRYNVACNACGKDIDPSSECEWLSGYNEQQFGGAIFQHVNGDRGMRRFNGKRT